MKASYQRYDLHFKRPSGTSRGVLTTKETWFLKLTANQKVGYGECGMLRGLSIDDRPDYAEKIQWLCRNINNSPEELLKELREFPSLQFGLETALQSLKGGDPFVLFPSNFTAGKLPIPINGLIWMGDEAFMKAQIDEKLAQGFSCIKLKIGAIDFEKELALLQFIRSQYTTEEIELRVDANGGFPADQVLKKLERLSELGLHSIEQPIRQGQQDILRDLCAQTPLPIALDEELIGVFDKAEKERLLQKVQPQYIVLKPSLIGGFSGTQQWIDIAEEHHIGWWITSALESNIGLNAIAQWTALKQTKMPQGLGTGGLYTNNLESPLFIQGEMLKYNPKKSWNLNALELTYPFNTNIP